MNDTDTIAPPDGGQATETSQPGSSSGSETVASESPQGQDSQESNNAGGEQSSTEGGREQGTETRRPQFKSKNQTIYELRQKMREREGYWENELGTVKTQLAEFQKMFRGQDRKPSRTFWEAPEEVLEERLQNHLTSLEERLAQRWDERQSERDQATRLKQESSEAAKLIRSQKGITDEDIADMRELLHTDPIAMRMNDAPMEQAEYLLYRWSKDRGITNKTTIKDKAATVTGGGPQAGAGRQWTEAQMEQAVVKLGDPKNWTDKEKTEFSKLEQEFMLAYKEGRVRK